MAVRARFYVSDIMKRANGAGTVEVGLKAVTRKTDDNVSWSKYTPSAELKMFVTDEGAQQWFEERLGKDVAISFEEIPDQQE